MDACLDISDIGQLVVMISMVFQHYKAKQKILTFLPQEVMKHLDILFLQQTCHYTVSLITTD